VGLFSKMSHNNFIRSLHVASLMMALAIILVFLIIHLI
jgi:hypothetical protein